VHAAAPTATLDPTDIKAIRERVQAKIASLNGTNARVGDMLSKTAPVEVGGCTNPPIAHRLGERGCGEACPKRARRCTASTTYRCDQSPMEGPSCILTPSGA
jgi:hypothetical protein